jgi:hypothetical protein
MCIKGSPLKGIAVNLRCYGTVGYMRIISPLGVQITIVKAVKKEE